MQQLKAYLRVARAAANEDSANYKRMLVAVAQQALRVLLIVAIYKVAYGVNANNALSFANAMWTIGISFIFFLNLGIRNLYIPMEREIVSGAVETSLIKPLDWRLTKVAGLLGYNAREFAIQLVVLPTMLLLMVGPPSVEHLTALSAVVFIIFFLMSVITAAALFLCVGMTAFWFNDARSTFRIVDKMALIFCGTFVPIALLPDVIQKIVLFLPFNIYAAPTRLFDPTFTDKIVPTLISGAIWVALMVAFCQFVWHRASRKMEVNGG